MRPASDQPAVKPVSPIPVDPALESLLGRIEALALEPGFQTQREIALSRALRPYAEYGQRLPLFPLPEELALAHLYLYADYYPEDGQLSLIEQLRDMIEVHVPEEERAWLDPLRHSWMDLLEVMSVSPPETGDGLGLRSLGSGKEFRVAGGEFCRTVQVGQALLTRLIRTPDRTVLAGAAIILSPANARAVFRAADEWRREMEAESGSFDLGEWEEFAKRFGHILMWQVAQARLRALIEADERLRLCTASGQPLLYAVALYEHREPRFLAGSLDKWEGLQPDSLSEPQGDRPVPAGTASVRSWIQREPPTDEPSEASRGSITARLILTPTQLMVECDSPERLDGLKHRLASTFGFSLHFRGESTAVPAHELPAMDLAMEAPAGVPVLIPTDEERKLLASFLESVYLEWADRPSPALGGRTPRHAAADPDGRKHVGTLIDQIERDDPARRRTGKAGYDYNVLRVHVGL